MIPVAKLLIAAFASVAAVALWKFSQFVYHQFTSPIRHLRGPNGTSWLYGNMRDIWNSVRHATFHLEDLISTNRTVLALF